MTECWTIKAHMQCSSTASHVLRLSDQLSVVIPLSFFGKNPQNTLIRFHNHRCKLLTLTSPLSLSLSLTHTHTHTHMRTCTHTHIHTTREMCLEKSGTHINMCILKGHFPIQITQVKGTFKYHQYGNVFVLYYTKKSLKNLNIFQIPAAKYILHIHADVLASLYYSTVQHSAVLVQCLVVQYSTVKCRIQQYCTVAVLSLPPQNFARLPCWHQIKGN